MSSLSAVSLSCEYQPIVCLQTGAIKAYEALARFYDHEQQAIAPNLVFEALHQCPHALSQTEYAAKCLQLAAAPPGFGLFVNLDPHSLDKPMLSALLPKLEAHPALVVELIENTCISDAIMASKLARELKTRRIAVALDDLGAPHAMLSLELLAAVDWIKFDRHWLSELHEPHCCALLQALIQFARASGKPTVIEGIETEAQRQSARELGIDMAQGFLFRPAFIHASERHALSARSIEILSS
ncbi:EAL domain-containing protein [Shewanella sp. JM162201]|uniref:EAL domain-containing protein n=1 Tax=Shewanella jiangmenensis TaxID=2837387 RepID=A0ABS5V7A9_9GAMM|nr:EAL domain-containing protein [Shewanella jiangmenensis]MBT1445546.1 EAL domain-containing protein [Shewanella jiangmenensis]